MSSQPTVVVAGAGAVGLCTAVGLAEVGCAVILCDGVARRANASGVAAGLLAPAIESAMEADLARHFPILREARELWRSLARRTGVVLDLTGAVAVGDEATVEGWVQTLQRVGAVHRRLAVGASSAQQPALDWTGPGLFTAEDWRLDAGQAIDALDAAAERLGVERVASDVDEFEAGRAVLANGQLLAADLLVAATGARRGLAPELAALTPIKGQIVRLDGVRLDGPVVRAAGLYIAPSASGVLVGATMEDGRSDLAVEAAVVDRLVDAAVRLAPLLAVGVATGAAGVRAATPDGLPLVGWSGRSGVLVAAGARRNGWLLAPLIARQIVRAVMDEAAGPYDEVLAASRFS